MLTQETPRTLGLLLYREYQDGASVSELSMALQLPPRWVEERIEAVRLCLEKQVRVECVPVPQARNRRGSHKVISIGSGRKRRSR